MLVPTFLLSHRVPQPVEFLGNDVAIPRPQKACPGDRLEYDYHIHIEAPAMVRLVSTVTLPGGFDTVLPARTGDTFQFNIASSGDITDTVGFVVPELPPGSYDRVVGVSRIDLDTFPSFLRIPFTIAEGCQ